MSPKLLTATAVLIALMFGVFAQSAAAQFAAECPFNDHGMPGMFNTNGKYVHLPPCADQEKYPGPFTVHPAAPTGAFGFGRLNITAAAPAAAPAATGGGDATAPLAATGASTDSLLRASLALIAAGTTSLGIRRHHNKQL